MDIHINDHVFYLNASAAMLTLYAAALIVTTIVALVLVSYYKGASGDGSEWKR
jgi:hypothetical protein